MTIDYMYLNKDAKDVRYGTIEVQLEVIYALD